tara:strand:+ start:903 stop:1526 length:624 start_codon:yes stop_codon:yes gene_type:complete
MAERPTYQRRGAQLRLPTFQDAVGQVGARGAAQKAQDLGRMTQFFLQQTQQQAEIAGAEYGALHAPTQQQLKDAMENKGDIDLPGGKYTVSGRAARQAALAITSDNLQHLAQTRITEIVLDAYKTQKNPTDLATEVDAVIAGYGDILDKNAPTLALNFRAKMGMYAHREYEGYAKSQIKTSTSSNKASVTQILLNERAGIASGGVIQ